MRDRLIKVAIERFGSDGFEGASTRQIARDAGTTMSSITYHFGGKQGLYEAAADYIFTTLATAIREPMIQPPAPSASRGERLDMVCTVLGRAAKMMLGEDTAPFAMFISREQQAITPAVSRLIRENIMPMLDVLVGQVSILRPDLSPKEARATGFYLFGMAVSLRSARASLLMVLDAKKLGRGDKDMLLQVLDSNIRQILGREAAA